MKRIGFTLAACAALLAATPAFAYGANNSTAAASTNTELIGADTNRYHSTDTNACGGNPVDAIDRNSANIQGMPAGSSAPLGTDTGDTFNIDNLGRDAGSTASPTPTR
ncbi:MAG TPA: hypothetical protein VGB97_00755 [Candidatus Paceibacterota bacterium]|jgi:hypothetical protein